MKSLFNTVAAVAVATTGATAVSAQDLTIAIVNNGHMINMQKVAEAYTAETGVNLNWVALEEGVLREQVTSDTATGGGQYDIINIGMQEAPIWGAAGWIEPPNFSADYDVDDILPAMRAGLSHNGTLYAAPFYGESSMVMYRKDLADAAGVKIRDNDSWANVKGAAMAMHDPDNGVYGACLRGKPGWGDNGAFITTVANSFGARWFDENMKPQLPCLLSCFLANESVIAGTAELAKPKTVPNIDSILCGSFFMYFLYIKSSSFNGSRMRFIFTFH